MFPNVFTYHSVNDAPDLVSSGIAIPTTHFAAHVEFFASRSVGVATLESRLNRGSQGVAITFDDGDADTLETAVPILQRFDCPAVVFVSSGLLDGFWIENGAKRRMLSTQQLRELSSIPGIEIGSHGHLHAPMTTRSKVELSQDIDRSKKTLEDVTGKPIRYLAYPYGLHNRAVMSAVESAGFLAAFGCLSVEGGRFALPRIGVSSKDRIWHIRVKSLAAYPPIINGVRKVQRSVAGAFARAAL